MGRGVGGRMPRTPDEAQRLLHELRVHQIELEMQNEELRRSRDEREELLERYTDLYDFAPNGYLTLDRGGTIRAANLTTTALLGIERSRLVGRRLGALITAAERPAFNAFLAKVFATGARESCEMTLETKGRPPLIAQIAAAATASGEECRLSVIDVTARRDAEETARASEDRLYKLAEMALDAIVMMDHAGSVTFCNAAALRIFDSPAATLEGLEFRTLFAPERLTGATARTVGRYNQSSVGGAPGGTAELSVVHRDGTRLPLEVSVSWVKLSGSWHAIAVLRDLTERRRLEARLLQAQKMETISQLAGGVAHDFNNILSVIMGYGSLLEGRLPAGDPMRAHLGRVLEAGDRGKRLIERLLDFHRPLQPTQGAPDLCAIIRSLEEPIRRLVGPGVRLNVTAPLDALHTTADEGAVERILTNLATNAAASMEDGGELTIRCEPAAMDLESVRTNGFGTTGRFAVLSVSDTGRGMDEATTQRIFEPFFTTRILGKGTGLGLSIVYSLVKQHDGFIDVSSKVGAGTTFRVYLPLLHGTKTQETRTAVVTPPGGSETILVAEDDDGVRLLTELLLAQRGYRVIVASDGAQAVAQFMAHRREIQLLLFDVMMPHKNGKEARDEIQALSPGVRVLFMSGYTGDILTQRDRAEGVNLMMKPFSAAELWRRVRETLDRPLAVSGK